MGPKHVELCHSNYNDSVRYIHRVYIHMYCVCLHHTGYICNILLQHQQNMAGEGRMDSYMSSGKMQKM